MIAWPTLRRGVVDAASGSDQEDHVSDIDGTLTPLADSTRPVSVDLTSPAQVGSLLNVTGRVRIAAPLLRPLPKVLLISVSPARRARLVHPGAAPGLWWCPNLVVLFATSAT